ncbi:MAG: S49 family peptidase [Polyangiaceae bacterium]|nr:S49 family peptidase [Polyangiaceae bacterium]MCW5792103.1 S49 family peptidase [Polyangiaceae bacterium]
MTQRRTSVRASATALRARALRLAAPVAALLAVLTLSGTARADLAEYFTGRLPAWGRSLAGTDDTTALAYNPANIGFMPGPEFRWTHGSGDWLEGNALSFATPLGYGLASGLRMDFLDRLSSIRMLTWGLAVTPSDAFSFGVSLQNIHWEHGLTEDINYLSVALTARSRSFSFSLVGQNLALPTDDRRWEGAAVNAGFTILPLGTRLIDLGLESFFIYEPGRDDDPGYPSDPEVTISPRLTLGFGLGGVARIFTSVSVFGLELKESPQEVYGVLGFSFYPSILQGSAELTLGTIAGDDAGNRPFFTEVAVRGFRERPGAEVTTSSVRLRLNRASDARGHLRSLQRLWRLADEPRIDTVLLELPASAVSSVAHAQELRDALVHLRSRGMRVVCHLERGDRLAVYACAAADKALVAPAGRLHFSSPSDRHGHLSDLLERRNIRADFARIAFHKSPAERATWNQTTRRDLVEQLERQVVLGVAAGRRLEPEAARQAIAPGERTATEARTANLVDLLVEENQLASYVYDLAGKKTKPRLLDEGAFGKTKARGFHTGRSIAVVYIDGELVEGDSASVPMLGTRLAGARTVTRALEQAREDSSVGAVIVRVETPGGSAKAAEAIRRAVRRTAKAKPLVVSMGGYAGGAGYYLSTPAERLFANPGSITGGINVLYAKADVASLAGTLGITGPPRASTGFNPYTARERQELNREVVKRYDDFLERVSVARKLTKRQSHELAQGRAWTGEQALGHGLVDELGGLRQAIAYVTKRAGLAADAPLLELPSKATLPLATPRSGVPANTWVPPEHRATVRALTPFFIYSADEPLMRLEQPPIRP